MTRNFYPFGKSKMVFILLPLLKIAERKFGHNEKGINPSGK